jgi:hypothetical protein
VNIPEDIYADSVPHVPLKVTQTPEGYEVTSVTFPGKVWKGGDEQTAIRAQQVEVKELMSKRAVHAQQHRPKWQLEEEVKKSTPGLRVPEKSKLG